jgi:hypothetical protein
VRLQPKRKKVMPLFACMLSLVVSCCPARLFGDSPLLHFHQRSWPSCIPFAVLSLSLSLSLSLLFALLHSPQPSSLLTEPSLPQISLRPRTKRLSPMKKLIVEARAKKLAAQQAQKTLVFSLETDTNADTLSSVATSTVETAKFLLGEVDERLSGAHAAEQQSQAVPALNEVADKREAFRAQPASAVHSSDRAPAAASTAIKIAAGASAVSASCAPARPAASIKAPKKATAKEGEEGTTEHGSASVPRAVPTAANVAFSSRFRE